MSTSQSSRRIEQFVMTNKGPRHEFWKDTTVTTEDRKGSKRNKTKRGTSNKRNWNEE